MTLFWKKLFTISGYALAACIIFAALLVSTTRLFTPTLNAHLIDFEKLISEQLNEPVKIQHVSTEWNIYKPVLVFDQIVILDATTHQPLFTIPRVRVSFDILRSLLRRHILIDGLEISGVKTTIHEISAGKLQIEGFNKYVFSDNFSGGVVGGNEAIKWILSQPYLALKNTDIHYVGLLNVERWVTVKSLTLVNRDQLHRLMGQGRLNQKTPTKLSLDVEWRGSLDNLPALTAHVYIYLEGLSLPQWLKEKSWQNLQVKEGIGSAKIWADWTNNAWQKIQTTLQFYDLDFYSQSVKKHTLFSRFSGDLGWKREGNNQVIAGENILIDLPNHLWPTTSFTIQYATPEDNKIAVQTLHFSYLDLADSISIALGLDLMPNECHPLFSALNLRGSLHDFNVENIGTPGDWSQLALSGQFSNLTFDAWKRVPGVSHLNGKFIWQNQKGNLDISSQRTRFTIENVFANSLLFDQITGQMNVEKTTLGEWQITAKNVNVINADLNANINSVLTIPVEGSPNIDLTGDFSVLNAAHAASYLPLKIFKPDLVTWLKTAFLSGQVINGQAILRGRLEDYPFDHNNGTFLIRGVVKDINLHYAPHWPLLQNTNGKLVFAGRAMTVDVTSADILGIPISYAHGEIPNLGSDDPQILNMQALVQSDLSQGLRFIHASPLEKTLGKNLAGLQGTGPMNLQLWLSIPFDNLDAIQVKGDTAITNSTIALPEWALTLDQLKGAFHFTEKSISSEPMPGRLFNKPITLSFTTANDNIVAHLQGRIAMTALENWIKLPLLEFAQGETNYQAELHLVSQDKNEPMQIIVHSNLAGVELKLPDIYGKKANVATDFQFIAHVTKNQPLNIKTIYGKLLSAALTIEKNNNQWNFISGELSLNSSMANWQQQPGLLISGQINELDWHKLQPYLSGYFNKKTVSSKFSKTEFFRGVDIIAKKVLIFGRTLNNLRIQLNKNADDYVLGLNNSDMAGQITLPADGRGTIQARFDYLYLTPQTGTPNTIDPASLPPISFIGNSVHLGNMNLGRFELNTSPSRNGLVINQLSLDSQSFTLRASGDWQTVKHASKTIIKGQLNSSNVSEMLHSWGFASSNLIGSNGSLQFGLDWSGSPYNPAVASMNGSLQLKLGKGRIINLGSSTDAKMGLGKILNVFSLQSIPRRLSLDFSDLFEEGYIFDSMKGDFSLKKGNAYTKNTRFQGPIASIEIAGRIGLAGKDFDINLGVTPYVTASLPLVATLATGLNPLAAVATFFVDRMVSKGISKATTYHYSITGSWDNPIWKEVSTGPAEKQ